MTVKSMLVGILVGVALALVLGAASNQDSGYQVTAVYGHAGANPSPCVFVARVNCALGEVVLVRQRMTEIDDKPTVCIPAGR